MSERCPASAEAVAEYAGDCPLCGEPADAHVSEAGGDALSVVFGE